MIQPLNPHNALGPYKFIPLKLQRLLPLLLVCSVLELTASHEEEQNDRQDDEQDNYHEGEDYGSLRRNHRVADGKEVCSVVHIFIAVVILGPELDAEIVECQHTLLSILLVHQIRTQADINTGTETKYSPSQSHSLIAEH